MRAGPRHVHTGNGAVKGNVRSKQPSGVKYAFKGEKRNRGRVTLFIKARA